MKQTFSDNKIIYSVDMMFAYIHLFKPEFEKIKISELLYHLDFDLWGDVRNIKYTPKDVLANPIKYEIEMNKINNSDLKYPIIIYKKYNKLMIVDGLHRLTKSFMLNKKTIKTYIFDFELMNKFIINRNKDWDMVDNIPIYKCMEIFYTRFI